MSEPKATPEHTEKDYLNTILDGLMSLEHIEYQIGMIIEEFKENYNYTDRKLTKKLNELIEK